VMLDNNSSLDGSKHDNDVGAPAPGAAQQAQSEALNQMSANVGGWECLWYIACVARKLLAQCESEATSWLRVDFFRLSQDFVHVGQMQDVQQCKNQDVAIIERLESMLHWTWPP
jgi:hypothetical protein